jgi:hypothetical protein
MSWIEVLEDGFRAVDDAGHDEGIEFSGDWDALAP